MIKADLVFETSKGGDEERFENIELPALPRQGDDIWYSTEDGDYTGIVRNVFWSINAPETVEIVPVVNIIADETTAKIIREACG